MKVRSVENGEDHWVCVDSGCGMSVVDEKRFRQYFPDSHIATMQIPIRVSGIGSDTHFSYLYSVIKVFVPARKNGQEMFQHDRASTRLGGNRPLKRGYWFIRKRYIQEVADAVARDEEKSKMLRQEIEEEEERIKKQQEINDFLISRSGSENQYKLHEEMGNYRRQRRKSIGDTCTLPKRQWQ